MFLIPKFLNFVRKILWEHMSKALKKSKKRPLHLFQCITYNTEDFQGCAQWTGYAGDRIDNSARYYLIVRDSLR